LLQEPRVNQVHFTKLDRARNNNPGNEPYKIIVAEDHVRFRHFITASLEAANGLSVVGEAGDGIELLELLEKRRPDLPDLIVLDISMPRLQGLEAARRIKMACPAVKVLILTMHKKKEYLQEALSAGVEGYLLKERADTELIGAIRQILQGKIYITPLMAES
jgi:two-component system, NarL family, response regulator NreC